MNLARGKRHWDATAIIADIKPTVVVISDMAELWYLPIVNFCSKEGKVNAPTSQ